MSDTKADAAAERVIAVCDVLAGFAQLGEPNFADHQYDDLVPRRVLRTLTRCS